MNTQLSNTIQPSVEISPAIKKFIDQVTHPILFRFFLLGKLPLALIARTRIKSLDTQEAKVSIPYGWLNKNPFNSTYFAALSMAGEMATGLLGLMAVRTASQPVLIIVSGMKSTFSKKAVGVTTFTCSQGHLFFEAVEQTLRTGEAVTVSSTSIGRDEKGMEVARFVVDWSIKKK